jgi:hypothetical protein
MKFDWGGESSMHVRDKKYALRKIFGPKAWKKRELLGDVDTNMDDTELGY